MVIICKVFLQDIQGWKWLHHNIGKKKSRNKYEFTAKETACTTKNLVLTNKMDLSREYSTAYSKT
jgi:hypothetical protein